MQSQQIPSIFLDANPPAEPRITRDLYRELAEGAREHIDREPVHPDTLSEQLAAYLSHEYRGDSEGKQAGLEVLIVTAEMLAQSLAGYDTIDSLDDYEQFAKMLNDISPLEKAFARQAVRAHIGVMSSAELIDPNGESNVSNSHVSIALDNQLIALLS
jgi:hypothetical protein